MSSHALGAQYVPGTVEAYVQAFLGVLLSATFTYFFLLQVMYHSLAVNILFRDSPQDSCPEANSVISV